jgi:hypothetical protein
VVVRSSIRMRKPLSDRGLTQMNHRDHVVCGQRRIQTFWPLAGARAELVDMYREDAFGSIVDATTGLAAFDAGPVDSKR